MVAARIFSVLLAAAPCGALAQDVHAPQALRSTVRPFIVGGTTARIEDFPWQVALIDGSQADPTRHQWCGGTLVTHVWVLTAAHCFFDPVSGKRDDNVGHYAVVSGTARYAEGGVRSAVAEIVIHSDFDLSTFANDIALVRLAAPVEQTPVQLALSNAIIPDELIVSGWGATSDQGQASDELLRVTLPLVSNAVCNEAQANDGAVLDTMLCAGPQQGGKDACQGDSGGPLVTEFPKVQVGIVSHGYRCALAGKYGVYTRVGSFRTWIDEIILRPSPAEETYTGPSRSPPIDGCWIGPGYEFGEC